MQEITLWNRVSTASKGYNGLSDDRQVITFLSDWKTQDERMSRMLELALEYADRGWKVFPLKPDSKIPLTKKRAFRSHN